MIFEQGIKVESKQISTNELNEILNYLFYAREIGNYSAHPKNNPNSIKFDLYNDKLFDQNTSEIDIEKFVKNIKNSFKKYKFIEKVEPEHLLASLFEGRYDNLLCLEDIDKEIFKDLQKNSDLNEEILIDFNKLDYLMNLFKSMKKMINEFCSDESNKINRTSPLFKEFFERLNRSFNQEETALYIISKIHMLEIKNPLIGENHIFVSECFNYILNNLSQKYDKLISEFNANIDKLKQKRNDKRNILEYLKKLKAKAETIHEEENGDERNYFLIGFIDYINKNKSEEQKKDYSEVKETLGNIRANLKLLLNEKIDWTKYEGLKLSSLLFLKQNNLI